ncbi:MAG: alanine racemase [Deltaproteobacteria bacterium]|nr:alanine racemase [Deltaproteobacteria bacterium]MBW2123241.1 alanine racemase [Deltaproteobacteria bacterium]
MRLSRPAWVEIDLDNIAHNVRSIRRLVRKDTRKDTEIMAVLKNDAYGHGIPEVAKTLYANGVSRFAVAMYSEGVLLRRALPEASVLILGYTPQYLYDELIAESITPTVFTFEDARSLSERALALGRRIRIHLKIDTGMHRLGFPADSETVALIKAIGLMPNIEIERIFTDTQAYPGGGDSGAGRRIYQIHGQSGASLSAGGNTPKGAERERNRGGHRADCGDARFRIHPGKRFDNDCRTRR